MNAAGTFFLLYLISVGWAGNAREAVDSVGEDAADFAPFLGAVLFLAFLNATKLKPLVSPFITLAVLATVLKNWETVENEIKTSYNVIASK